MTSIRLPGGMAIVDNGIQPNRCCRISQVVGHFISNSSADWSFFHFATDTVTLAGISRRGRSSQIGRVQI
jgi:hypothetical protein